MKTKILADAAVFAVSALTAAACSSDSGDSEPDAPVVAAGAAQTDNAIELSSSSTDMSAASPHLPEPVADTTSAVVPFEASNGEGTITLSGTGPPVAAWFASQPGEMSLDLADADAADDVSVVEGLASFWFFSDDDSGDVPPSIMVSAGGEIMDSLRTRYVVEAQGFPAENLDFYIRQAAQTAHT